MEGKTRAEQMQGAARGVPCESTRGPWLDERYYKKVLGAKEMKGSLRGQNRGHRLREKQGLT